MSNFDCTNAFASTNRELLREQIDRAAEEFDLPHAYGALGHAALPRQAAGERVDLKSSKGAQMGLALAP
eukprot:8819005-Pyramimonas_sp.AAC.1